MVLGDGKGYVFGELAVELRKRPLIERLRKPALILLGLAGVGGAAALVGSNDVIREEVAVRFASPEKKAAFQSKKDDMVQKAVLCLQHISEGKWHLAETEVQLMEQMAVEGGFMEATMKSHLQALKIMIYDAKKFNDILDSVRSQEVGEHKDAFPHSIATQVEQAHHMLDNLWHHLYVHGITQKDGVEVFPVQLGSVILEKFEQMNVSLEQNSDYVVPIEKFLAEIHYMRFDGGLGVWLFVNDDIHKCFVKWYEEFAQIAVRNVRGQIEYCAKAKEGSDRLGKSEESRMWQQKIDDLKKKVGRIQRLGSKFQV